MTNNSTIKKFQEKKQETLSILNGIFIEKDLIADALASIPRDIFVPENKQNLSPIQDTLLIDQNKILMSPSIIAQVLNHISIDLDKTALVIGCGTGYLAAILSKLYLNIFAVEPNALLNAKAKENFLNLEIDNIILLDSLTAKSIEHQAPYDLIFIEGAAEKIPAKFFEQLSNNGQLVSYTPINNKIGRITCYEKKESFWKKIIILETWMPKIEEFNTKDTFVF